MLRAHQGKDPPKPELLRPGCEWASSPLRKPQRTGLAGSSFPVSSGAMDPWEILCCFSKVIAGLDLVLPEDEKRVCEKPPSPTPTWNQRSHLLVSCPCQWLGLWTKEV